jgi:hypothetical protein
MLFPHSGIGPGLAPMPTLTTGGGRWPMAERKAARVGLRAMADLATPMAVRQDHPDAGRLARDYRRAIP